ncbi:STAS domain-containing protein [Neisseria leonii]|uniref:STAS domain-containing protein n=1 Tax=Neisseria leonii TaxID=2995413 RepID=A0A9X4E7Y8_9NEIS|nr:STAS domain-containing protein [Neisseria sp. 51.81]MDD9328712.1 STAS domain-containing protein [Neisseria sp. 51.81]
MQIRWDNGVLWVGGEVTVKTLTPAACRAFEEACRRNPTVIDWSEAGRVDSACVSLLLTALRTATVRPQWRALPAVLEDLAGLYEIRHWILS